MQYDVPTHCASRARVAKSPDLYYNFNFFIFRNLFVKWVSDVVSRWKRTDFESHLQNEFVLLEENSNIRNKLTTLSALWLRRERILRLGIKDIYNTLKCGIKKNSQAEVIKALRLFPHRRLSDRRFPDSRLIPTIAYTNKTTAKRVSYSGNSNSMNWSGNM